MSAGHQSSPATLLDEVCELALAWERPDIAVELRQFAALRSDATTTVVVAGEAKRGKSRFVNSLLSRRICPVDADTASNAFVSLGYAGTPRATVFTDDAPDGQEIPVDDVATWGSEQGNPANSRRVRMIEVGLPHPVLAHGLRIIDTPGVGGLNAAHRQVTMAALERADALIFVLDADAPISRGERDFLNDASGRVASVLLVMTKIDIYLDWELILSENRRLIDRHDDRLRGVPWVAVSASDKEDADDFADEAMAAASGFKEVESILVDQLAGRAFQLRAWTLARSIGQAVEQLAQQTGLEVSASATTLDALRAQLSAHKERTRSWTSIVFTEHQRRVANPIQLEFRRTLRLLTERYESRLSSGQVELEQLADDLNAELRGLDCAVRNEIVRTAADFLIFLSEMLELGLVDLGAEVLGKYQLPIDLPPVSKDAVDRRNAGAGMSKASTIVRSSLYGRSLTMAMGPVGLLLGVAVGGLGLAGSEWSRRKERTVHAARALLSQAMETARLEIDADVRARLLDAQQYVQQQVRSAIEERSAALDREIKRCERALRYDTAQRESAQALADQRLEQTRALRARAKELCDRAEHLMPRSPSGESRQSM